MLLHLRTVRGATLAAEALEISIIIIIMEAVKEMANRKVETVIRNLPQILENHYNLYNQYNK